MTEVRNRMREIFASKLEGFEQFAPMVALLRNKPRKLTIFLEAAVQAGVEFAAEQSAEAVKAEREAMITDDFVIDLMAVVNSEHEVNTLWKLGSVKRIKGHIQSAIRSREPKDPLPAGKLHNWMGDPDSTGGEHCSRCGVGRIGTPDDGCSAISDGAIHAAASLPAETPKAKDDGWAIEGYYYGTRDGRRVGPLKRQEHSAQWPWFIEGVGSFDRNGNFNGQFPHTNDLDALHRSSTPEPKADWRDVPVDAEMFVAGLALLAETPSVRRVIAKTIERLAQEKANSNA